MKIDARLLIAAIAVSSIGIPVLADPVKTGVNPGIQRTEVKPLREDVRRALLPPVPTGPCMAELSMDRIEISKSANGFRYNINITITNIGTEAATGWQTDAGAGLGVRVLTGPNSARATLAGQLADIANIPAGASQVFSGSIPVSAINSTTRQVTASIDRGPDGPRCGYDTRRNNDGIGVNGMTVKNWLAAGNASYVYVALWAR